MIRSSPLDFALLRKTLNSTTNTYLSTEISDGERSLCEKDRDHRSTLGRLNWPSIRPKGTFCCLPRELFFAWREIMSECKPDASSPDNVDTFLNMPRGPERVEALRKAQQLRYAAEA